MVFSNRIFEKSNFENLINFDVDLVVMFTIMESGVYDPDCLYTIPTEIL